MSTMKANILIVEDHEAVRLLLGMTLRRQYNVITKRDGVDAMSWLVSGNIPDLIILDLQMPRLNGLDFLRQLKTSGVFSNIPVLMVSANDDDLQNAQAFDLGASDFIKKPFNPIHLNEKVSSILAKRKQLTPFNLS